MFDSLGKWTTGNGTKMAMRTRQNTKYVQHSPGNSPVSHAKLWVGILTLLLRGHSTTTWTEFCHFLAPPPSFEQLKKKRNFSTAQTKKNSWKKLRKQNCFFCLIDVTQSYEIKSLPWTILCFRLLGIFSVRIIARLGVFMIQTSDNSQLCIGSNYSSLLSKQPTYLYFQQDKGPPSR